MRDLDHTASSLVPADKSSHITLMIMPEDLGAEPRRVRFRRVWFRVGAAIAGVLFLVTAAGALYGWSARGAEAQRNQLLSENQRLRQALSSLDSRIQHTEAQAEKLGQLDTRLRRLAMVQDSERNLAMGPIGGATVEHEAEDAELRAGLLAKGGVSHLERRLDRVGQLQTDTASQAERLSVFLDGRRALLHATPSRRPTRGFITSTYGMRVDPFTGLPQMHSGLDFSAPEGTPVSATADGTVVTAGRRGAYGLVVELDHGQGLTTRYAHLNAVHVKRGAKVKRGDQIGEVGNTGRSTGPHLHYEVRLGGISRNPQAFVLE